MSTTVSLLYLGANPAHTENIQIRNELMAIKQSKPPEGSGYKLEVRDSLLVQTDDLRPLFDAKCHGGRKVDLLHIAAHGTDKGNLLVHGEQGGGHPLEASAFADLLKITNTKLKLAVFNACYSADFAEKLKDHIACVIGTTSAVRTNVALKFSATFYRCLMQEAMSIQRAYDETLVDLNLTGHSKTANTFFIKPYEDNAEYVAPFSAALVTDTFVIQAIGSPRSKTRERADEVFRRLISPACHDLGMVPIRAHTMPTSTIREPIVNSLHTAPLVIADLGKSPWNANVMVEVGYRLSNGRPLVIIADNPDKNLPKLIDPNKVVQASADVGFLTAMCKSALGEPQGWVSDYPTVDITVTGNDLKTAKYSHANSLASRFFGYETPEELVGLKTSDVDPRISGWMPKEHADAFDKEQALLIRQYLIDRRGYTTTVRYPIWFIDHKYDEFINSSYLPVLTQKRHAVDGGPTMLRVAFIPITDWMHRRLSREPYPTTAKLPIQFRAYESLNRDILCIHGGDRMQDAVVLQGLLYSVYKLRTKVADAEESQADVIRKYLHRAKLVVLIMGERGLPLVDQEALAEELERTGLEDKPVVVLHEGDWEKLCNNLTERLREIIKIRKCLYLPTNPNILNLAKRELSDDSEESKLDRLIRCVIRLVRQELEIDKKGN